MITTTRGLTVMPETGYRLSEKETRTYVEELEKVIRIPDGYSFHTVKSVKSDNVEAYLFRFEKPENKGLQGEHFSFLISKKDKQILGFSTMDKKYSNVHMLSESETQRIATEFLFKLDKTLAANLENLWIERHDEAILINGEKTAVAGMKYKCYYSAQNDYCWVIVGFDGSVVTFERNIKWDNGKNARITEKWLHDYWLIHTTTDEQELKTLVEETFANAALNKLNVEEMSRGFHPDFAILIAKDNSLFRLPLQDWMEVVKAYKDAPDKRKSGIRNLDYAIEVMYITGNVAIVKTQFFRDKKLIITDYLSYIKYPDGWKAVAKVSNEHIVNPLQLNL
ncbi:Putative lumazine-binding [Sphingobacterium spiritivorum]|uniref:Lumazine-binding n=1 Tax=Sphingobacterium spiritivorum TaxID=258 RepID=A0A380BLB4_SPHSI|nr:nuclear transport factor 2 family protein [Sphingobacterium spiritivorum]SUJ02642.1 Putative lumazine-binding [Sphingobacterium spiritivorum]